MAPMDVDTDIDLTGTPDIPSAEAMPERVRTDIWAEYPGYVLAAAVIAGFLLGRAVRALIAGDRS